MAILAQGASCSPLYRLAGFHTMKVGDEAVVRTADFSLEGRPIRKVRQSVNRLRRAGYTRATCSQGVRSGRAAMQELPGARRGGAAAGRSEGSRWRWTSCSANAGTLFVVGARRRRAGAAGSSTSFPRPPRGGYSLSAMRRCRGDAERPDGVPGRRGAGLERRRGRCPRSRSTSACSPICCGPAMRSLSGRRRPLRGCSRSTACSSSSGCSASPASSSRNGGPRFLCVERISDFPAVGLAYLRAESLLLAGPMGPLRRAA